MKANKIEYNTIIQKCFKEKEKLLKIINELLLWNQKINLITRKNSNSALERIIKTVLIFNNIFNIYLKENILIDIGSGNGLFIFCLSILNKGIREIYMYEKKHKKYLFLNYINNLYFNEKIKLINKEFNIKDIEGGNRIFFFQAVNKEKLKLGREENIINFSDKKLDGIKTYEILINKEFFTYLNTNLKIMNYYINIEEMFHVELK